MTNPFARLLRNLAQVSVFVIAALLTEKNDDGPAHIQSGITGSGGPNGQTGELSEAYDKVVNALPDRTPVKYDDFKKQVGTDITSLFPGTNPDTITRNGQHITLDNPAASSQTLGSAELKLAKRVEFDLSNGGGDLQLTNIKGVKVSVSGAPALDLNSVNISRDGNGNTTISGKVLVSRFLPYLPFKFTLGPDGQLVTGK